MSSPKKRARMSPAQESNEEEKNEQFQRRVLNMMQLHPEGHVLAERVFERMPLEGFVDMKKVLLPENEVEYDSLLSFDLCEVILNKFEKEEPLLRPLRKEYEGLTETRPRLSGVCEITSGLWNVKYNVKMKSKNHVNIDIEPLFLRVGVKFDFSTDFLVSTMRLYDESDVDENEHETRSFQGKKLIPVNIHTEDRPGVDATSLYLFMYHLDREDPKIVMPKLVQTLELADFEYRNFVSYHHKDVMHFRVCENLLAVAKLQSWRERYPEIGRVQFECSYCVEFYDMEKSRKGVLDPIYTIDKLSALGWCYDPIVRVGADYDNTHSSWDSTEYVTQMYPDYWFKYGRKIFYENLFICSRDQEDSSFSVEVHKISSEECSLVKNIELQTHPGCFFDNLFIESLGNSSWNFFISSLRSEETRIIYYDKKKNELIARLESGDLESSTERVVQKLKSEGYVLGHVRLFEECEPDTEEWTSYFKFYA